jgi:hypothetical protein
MKFKKVQEPKLLAFFMPEHQFKCENENMISTADIINDYSGKGLALTMYAGPQKIDSQDFKLYLDDMHNVQRIEMYQPMIPQIISEQMRYATFNKLPPVYLSPYIDVLRVIEKEGDIRRIEGREYIKVYPNERAAKIDLGVKVLHDIEDERKLVSNIVQKMYNTVQKKDESEEFSTPEYWIVDSVIQMREMGSLEKFKMPLRK